MPDTRIPCRPSNNVHQFYSTDDVLLPWWKQTPKWRGQCTCVCGEDTMRCMPRRARVFPLFPRLPHWMQFILCHLRFPRGCPHILPGQRWSAR